jgi:hypothetical protein
LSTIWDGAASPSLYVGELIVGESKEFSLSLVNRSRTIDAVIPFCGCTSFKLGDVVSKGELQTVALDVRVRAAVAGAFATRLGLKLSDGSTVGINIKGEAKQLVTVEKGSIDLREEGPYEVKLLTLQPDLDFRYSSISVSDDRIRIDSIVKDVRNVSLKLSVVEKEKYLTVSQLRSVEMEIVFPTKNAHCSIVVQPTYSKAVVPRRVSIKEKEENLIKVAILGFPRQAAMLEFRLISRRAEFTQACEASDYVEGAIVKRLENVLFVQFDFDSNLLAEKGEMVNTESEWEIVCRKNDSQPWDSYGFITLVLD